MSLANDIRSILTENKALEKAEAEIKALHSGEMKKWNFAARDLAHKADLADRQKLDKKDLRSKIKALIANFEDMKKSNERGTAKEATATVNINMLKGALKKLEEEQKPSPINESTIIRSILSK